jgi:hypothetical protein
VSTQPGGTLEAAFGPAYGNSGTSQILTNLPSLNLQGGFRLDGEAIFAWTSTPPARSQLAFQISAEEPTIDIDVDVNRDGNVDQLDENDEHHWTVARGAFVTANQWASFFNLGQLSNTAIEQLAPVHIRRIGYLPAGYTIRVSAEGNREVSLIYRDSASPGGFSRTDLSVGIHEIDPSTAMGNDVVMYLAAHFDLGRYQTTDDAIVKLKLKLLDPSGAEISVDVVALQVAPIALAWNSLPPEQLYCASKFPQLPGTEAIRIEHDHKIEEVLVPWLQDFMELGESQTTDMSSVNQLLDLNDPRNGTEFLDHNFLNDADQWHLGFWNNGGHGGNIEVFPPYRDANNVNYPFGRVVMGSDHSNVADRVAKQRLQSPLVIDLRWLRTGHIDEVVGFLDNTTVLTVDPGLAMALVAGIVANPNGADGKIRVSTGYTSLDQLPSANRFMVDAPNYFFIARAATLSAMDANTTTVRVSNPNIPGALQVGSFLCIRGENMKVINVVSNSEGKTLTVERNQLWSMTAGEGHPNGEGVHIWSRDMVLNPLEGPDGTFESTIAREMGRFRTRTFGAQGLNTQVNYIPCPVLFWSEVVGPRTLWSAATANLANAVVVNNIVHMTDPGNELFRQWTENHLQAVGPDYAVNWVSDDDAWNIYHVHQGELHCGSNIKRSFSGPTFPNEPWWNLGEFQNWGEQ